MAAPTRVGILNDTSDGPPGPSDLERWLHLAVEEVASAGRIDREVTFVHSWGLGLPAGTAAAVERAYSELVDQDVLLIVGPAIGDNALVATPLADRARVPTINWAGSERARSEYMFHLQVGSHEEEPVVLVGHLASIGVKRLGIVYDRSPIGRRYLEFFEDHADVLSLRLSAVRALSPIAEDATAEVTEVLEANPEAVVYLGLGLAVPAVARALTAAGWQGPKAMNTAGIRGHAPEFASLIDGWLYIDMYSDHNSTFSALRDHLGGAPSHLPAAGYDLGRLVAEAVARAPEHTRDGLKAGLERIKWLPAAEGHEGTMLGFGHHDRGALHGRYLVLRQWVQGRSVEVVSPV